MAKRSPFESYHRQQRKIDAKVFELIKSTAHMCLCGHAQGFHWDTNGGKNVGECAPADCDCTAFDEDVLFHARLQAELAAGTSVKRDEASDDDALTRAMRDEAQRDIGVDEAWDRALHAKRPNPIGKPRPDTLYNPAAMDALRELGGKPEDLSS